MSEQLVLLGCRDGERFDMRCPFLATDGGRSRSKRARQKNDCTVRALALAAGVDYDMAYDALAAAGRQVSRGFDFRKWAAKAEFGGYRFQWVPFPARKGEWRMNPVTFAIEHPTGRFILRLSKHVVACVDGVVMDTSSDQGAMGLEWRCVYGAWRLEPSQ